MAHPSVMRRRALPALALAGCVSAQGLDRFGLGVASGDPWSNSVVLWTRLDPAPAGPAEVGWQIAHDEGFQRVAAQGVAVAQPEMGHSVHVEVGGLEPGRAYFYRFRTDGALSRIGRTRTALAPGSGDAVRFVAASCQNYEHGHFTAWRHIAAEELDFVFFAGDYIYEYGGRAVGSVGGWGPVVRSHDGPETITLAQYRDRYAQYRRDPDLQAAHAAHPFIVSFDDHEVDNNWAGAHPRANSLTQGDFGARKAAAFQAWYEHMPVRAAQWPAGAAITAHRRFRFGRDMALHVLDTRSYRDDQPCGDGVKPECEAVARPDAQMLGAGQEAWLLEGARGPGLHVLAQQVFVAPRLFPNGGRSMDAWDGYPAARARMLAGLHGQGVANPVFLTGDVHRAWAAELPGGGPGGGAAQGSEFVCTSISSEGDGLEALTNAPVFMAGNPHFRFHHARRGYTRFSARGGVLVAEFRAIAYVSQPDAAVATVGRFGTQSRAPGIAPV